MSMSISGSVPWFSIIQPTSSNQVLYSGCVVIVPSTSGWLGLDADDASPTHGLPTRGPSLSSLKAWQKISLVAAGQFVGQGDHGPPYRVPPALVGFSSLVSERVAL
jgi:hypothetical protein